MIIVIRKVKSDSNGTHIVNILFRTILLLILWEFCIAHPDSTRYLVPFISGINPCSIPPTKGNLKRNNRNKIKIRSNTNKNINLKSKNKNEEIKPKHQTEKTSHLGLSCLSVSSSFILVTGIGNSCVSCIIPLCPNSFTCKHLLCKVLFMRFKASGFWHTINTVNIFDKIKTCKPLGMEC